MPSKQANPPRLSKSFCASWRAGLLLVLVCCAVYLPGQFSIAPIDRDESRFAQASRQMFESAALPENQQDPALHDGGLAVPKVGPKLRLNKPPLIYWLQAGSAAVFTAGDPLQDAIWMYRLPSALCSTLAALALWRLGLRMLDPRAGFLAALMLALCPMVVWDAHQARADQLLLLCTTLAMAGLWRVWGEQCRDARAILLLWAAIAAGVLTKGPITPMVVALAAAALCWWTNSVRWIWRSRPILGVLIVAACVAPWVYLIAQRIGLSTYAQLVYDETIGRSGSAKEGHWGPPGYHTALLLVLFWPGSMLTLVALVRAWKVGLTGTGARLARLRRGSGARKPELFCLAWILPSWIVFELVGTKLPHYTLPLYPAIALLTARALLAVCAHKTSLSVHLRRAWWLIGAGLTVAAGLALYISWTGTARSCAGAALLVGALGLLLTAAVWLARGVPLRAQILGFASAGALWVALVWGALPNIVTVSRDIARQADGRPVGAVGYHEDSLRFWARGRMTPLGAEHVAGWTADHPGGVVIAPVGQLDAVRAEAARWAPFARVRGLNYSNGEEVDLVLLRRLENE